MGVEQLRDGSIIMLVLDPSHSPAQMSHFNSTSSAPGAMRLVRKSTAAMKARQYQVVAVTGTMDTEAQYQVITPLNHLVIYGRHARSARSIFMRLPLYFSYSLSLFFSKVKFYDQCVFLKTGESCWFEKQMSSRLEARRL